MKIITYIKESFEELVHHTTWMSAVKAQQTTVIVLSFSVVFALLIFITDEFFRRLLGGFFNFF